MSNNPLNLLLRFVQEIIALVVVSYWGFQSYQGIARYLMGIGAPLFMATIWGVFAVSGDPSRSGKTVVDTPGPIRLLIELAFFTVATFAFYQTGNIMYVYVYAGSVVLHYVLSYDRVFWLFTRK